MSEYPNNFKKFLTDKDNYDLISLLFKKGKEFGLTNEETIGAIVRLVDERYLDIILKL